MNSIMKNQHGFTLVQVLIVIVAVSIAATVAIKMLQQGSAEARRIETLTTVQEVQRAISGDVRLKNQSDFGFVGDMGRVPQSFQELITNTTNSPNWKGPYLPKNFTEETSNPFVDAWGNALLYDNQTGQIGVDPKSAGNVPIVIPEPFEEVNQILYGSIEGYIVDKYNNPPKKGHRRHILVFMEPINDNQNWPQITYNLDRDRRIFHMERVYHLYHPVWNSLWKFCDAQDVGRDWWRSGWVWKRNPNDNDADDDDYEQDEHGNSRRFDPHFVNFWLYFILPNEYVQDFLKVKVFIHPDRYGYYHMDNIPVKPYIITCYNDLLEMSVKDYVVIPSNKVVKKNFRFDTLFPGYQAPPDTSSQPAPSRDMAYYLTFNGNLIIDGFSDDDIKLGNSGQSPISINKMKVDWSDSRGYQRLRKIYINNVKVFEGWANANSTIDITNTVINPQSSNIPVRFEFGLSLSGKRLDLEFTMTDNSKKEYK